LKTENADYAAIVRPIHDVNKFQVPETGPYHLAYGSLAVIG